MMIDRKAFFDSIRPTFGGRLSQGAVDTLNLFMDEWEVRRLTDLRWLAYIMATALGEVGRDLQPKRENLNYTTAERIREVWPSRFPTKASASPYVRQPQKLANFVYANRLGNGPPESGDGWRFRGGGFPQTTGRENYARMSGVIGIDILNNPDRALEPRIAVLIL